MGSEFGVNSGSEANISGDIVSDGFEAFSDSLVNLVRTEFLIDGVLLDLLRPGETMTIADRDVTLSGRLADGSPFSFDLNLDRNAAFFNSVDFFDVGATLTVTLVPEPTALCLLLSGVIYVAVQRKRDSA